MLDQTDVFTFPHFAAAGPELEVGQTWINELCSIVEIEQHDSGTGLFVGSHENFEGIAKGRFKIAGFKDTKGNTIAWILDWKMKTLTLVLL